MEFLHRMLRKRRCQRKEGDEEAVLVATTSPGTTAPVPATPVATVTTLGVLGAVTQELARTTRQPQPPTPTSSTSSSPPPQAVDIVVDVSVAADEDETASALASAISFALMTTAAANDAAGVGELCPHGIFDFPLGEWPAIGFGEYVRRCIKYFDRSTTETYLLALDYIDRLAATTAKAYNVLVPCRNNYYRLFAAAMTVASKYHDEHHHPNRYLARVFGIPTPELNALECEFLNRIHFDLVVDLDEFESYHSGIAPLALAIAQGTNIATLRCPTSPLLDTSPRVHRHRL